MAIELIDTIKPKNGGSFPMVEAKDVAMPDGRRLDTAMPVVVTQEAYDAMVEAGTVDDRTLYFIREEAL